MISATISVYSRASSTIYWDAHGTTGPFRPFVPSVFPGFITRYSTFRILNYLSFTLISTKVSNQFLYLTTSANIARHVDFLLLVSLPLVRWSLGKRAGSPLSKLHALNSSKYDSLLILLIH
ncbi:hypothetical protein L2E82_10567 [Cichorium intybus]|uniref:Uncharacterized protein n=1 Tax=Cichorium intybus TaxID=13427 RepID=A0ACB9GBK0_CICIN|nr:hypothetical protein L2E82_10567 [Cichorium intybus]